MTKRIDPSRGPGKDGGGLTHSPFAALRGRAGDAASVPGSGGADADGSPEPDDAHRASSGSGERVEVRRERKGRGGKTVTQLRWLCGGAEDLTETARSLGAALGTGARVEEGGAIVLQGDLVERAARWLEGRPGTEVVRGTS
ncbi:MAG: translation initiation factor [Planctomycetota bacterium]